MFHCQWYYELNCNVGMTVHQQLILGNAGKSNWQNHLRLHLKRFQIVMQIEFYLLGLQNGIRNFWCWLFKLSRVGNVGGADVAANVQTLWLHGHRHGQALVAALQWPKMTRPVPRELYMEEQARWHAHIAVSTWVRLSSPKTETLAVNVIVNDTGLNIPWRCWQT